MLKTKKNKYFLSLAFIILFLFSTSGFVNALEVNYPSIPLPGIDRPSQDCVGSNCFPQYIAYIFGLLIYIAGILALISFAVGAVGLINPNVEAHSEAKDRMKGAVLGLGLTLASYIILKTINPILVNPTLTPLPGGLPGVFLVGGGQEVPCPGQSSDTSTLMSKGFNQIKYVCTGDSKTALLVIKFPQTGLEGGNGDLSDVSVENIPCPGGGTTGIGSGSFKIIFETPGVYYYLNSCSGYTSGANLSSQDSIPDPFWNKNIYVKIVNDLNQKNGNEYGAIFHKVVGLENAGECTSAPITDTGCQSAGVEVSAADIFRLNKNYTTSGDGIAFYSEPFGWDAGSNAGFLKFKNDEIRYPSETKQADSITFDYTYVTQPDTYKNTCKTFKDCSGSIKVSGDYLVALYSGDNCQTFNKDVTNLLAQPIMPTILTKIDDVFMIPIK